MVSPQLSLAIGVAIPLLAIGGYAAWLGRRVERLEREADRPAAGEEPDGEE